VDKLQNEFMQKYVLPFDSVSYEYDGQAGFIVWRMGTGGNAELLHIKAYELREGLGRALLYKMLDRLADQPPYHTVYGFSRVSNKRAASFYKAMGFHLVPVDGVYKDGKAIMFWQEYSQLVRLQRRYLKL
jgi:ribosomal protein S18 acetylase RimI-like enzyme